MTSLQNWLGTLTPDAGVILSCVVNMLLGGAVAVYIRELYKRTSSTLTNRDSFSATFPMLTMVTVVIIYVVKSSLALSLGLVGALSIVRFRAAIRSAEELVYLFFCIGVGLALGAEHRLLALAAVLVISAFVLARRFLVKPNRRHNLVLTVTSDADRFFADEGTSVLETLDGYGDKLEFQRFDMEDGQVQFRAHLDVPGRQEVLSLMETLRSKLPGSQVSYVDLETVL